MLWLSRAFALLAVLCLPLLVLYAAFPAIAVRVAGAYAAGYGLTIQEAQVGRPALDGLEVTALALSSRAFDLTLSNVALSWSMASLMAGRLETLSAERAVVVLRDYAPVEVVTGPDEEALPAVGGIVEGVFTLLPFDRVDVLVLVVEVPALSFRSAGEGRLREDGLSLRLLADSPAQADGLELDVDLTRDGQVAATLAQAGAEPAFLSIRSTLPVDELRLEAKLDLSGFAFALLQTVVGLPQGEGALRGDLVVRHPWPIGDRPRVEAVTARGPLVLDWTSPDGRQRVEAVTGDVHLESGRLQAELEGVLRLALEAGEVRFSPTAMDVVLAPVTAALAGELDLMVAGVALTGAARVRAAPDGPESMNAEVGLTGQLAGWDRIFPLQLASRATLTGSALSARATLTSGVLTAVPLSLEADLAEPKADLGIRHGLTFRAPLLADLWPGWDVPADLDTGALDLDLTLGWQPDAGMAGTFRLGLDRVAAHLGELALRGLNGTLVGEISGEQAYLQRSEIRMSLMDAGVPIRNLTTTLAGNLSRLEVGETRASVLGGSLVAAPFAYDVATGAAALNVTFEGVELSRLLALEGEQVTGTGVLDGTLPLSLRDGRFLVSDGHVAARPPGGRLQLSRTVVATLSRPGLDYALGPLTDFQYDLLEATVDYSAEGDLLLGVHLEGRNPEFRQGQRYRYNLNLTDNVPTLLRSLRMKDAFAERIRLKLQQ